MLKFLSEKFIVYDELSELPFNVTNFEFALHGQNQTEKRNCYAYQDRELN